MPSQRVLEEKRRIIEKIKSLARNYRAVGIVDFRNLPARQLQDLRARLRGTAEIFMTKKRLIRIALEELEKEGTTSIKQLEEHLEGQPALIFTSQNPFKLFKFLKENQSKAPIKAGQEAPEDIVVKAGKTNFTPGPIIGELGAFKIKTGVEGGKVVIKEDVTVAKKGEIVNEKLASILQRLGIEPMRIGLKLNAIWEEGVVYTPEVLDVSTEKILEKITMIARNAHILAIETGYVSKDTINELIAKAYREARMIGIEKGILAKELVKDIISRAEAQAQLLKQKIN